MTIGLALASVNHNKSNSDFRSNSDGTNTSHIEFLEKCAFESRFEFSVRAMFGTTGSLNFPMAYEFEHDSTPGSRNTLGKRKCCRTRVETCLWVAVGILLALLIGLAIATAIIGVQFAELKHRAIELGITSNSTSQCLDISCVLTAAKMKEAMDESIHPCDDFYQFACGGWMKQNPVPVSGRLGQFEVIWNVMSDRIKDIMEEDSYDGNLDPESNDTVSRFPEPLLLAQQFYDVCVAQDKADSNTMADFIDYTDSMFQIRNITSDISTLGSVLGILRRKLSANYMFQLYVALNETNTTANVIYLDQPELGLDREYLLDPMNGQVFREAYYQLISQVWALVYPLEAAQANTIAGEILSFEIALANNSMNQDARRNKSMLYNPMSLDELYNLTKNDVHAERMINWKNYFEQVFKILLSNRDFFGVDLAVNKTELNDTLTSTSEPLVPGYTNLTFADYDTSDDLLEFHLNQTFRLDFNNTVFIVRDVAYFSGLEDVLNKFRTFTIADYLKWRVLFALGKEVNGQLRNLFFQFEQKTNGALLPAPLWKDCIERANYYFGMAISYRYVEKYFDQSTLKKAQTLVADISTTFLDMLGEADWLDTETKYKALIKARKMKSHIGYPEWLRNVTRLEQYYRGLDFSSPQNHLHNMIDLGIWSNRKDLAEILKTKRDRWIADPTIVNAFYSPIYNSINFPAGILQSPFYTMSIEALNYGAIGSIIGHEITHGFDNIGSQNDENGNLRNWWNETTLQNYRKKAKCFEEQYSNYTAHEVNMTVNGLNTLSENIADNGGLRQAFRAYKRFQANQSGKQKLLPGLSQYSSDQLFFLSYAQIQCEVETLTTLLQQIQTDPHSPSRFRVKGVLANSKEFASTWGCPIPAVNSICELW